MTIKYDKMSQSVLFLMSRAATVMNEGTELCRQEDAWRLYEEMSRSRESG